MLHVQLPAARSIESRDETDHLTLWLPLATLRWKKTQNAHRWLNVWGKWHSSTILLKDSQCFSVNFKQPLGWTTERWSPSRKPNQSAVSCFFVPMSSRYYIYINIIYIYILYIYIYYYTYIITYNIYIINWYLMNLMMISVEFRRYVSVIQLQ